MAVAGREPAELAWVFRPNNGRPVEIQALAGVPIHAAGSADANGKVEVVLRDGTRIQAQLAEIMVEEPTPRRLAER